MPPESANQLLIETIGLSPVASVISNPRRPDNPLEVANRAFSELTGYDEKEIVGRNCRFLAGAGTEPWISERIRSAVAARRPVLVDILNYRSDGTPFRNGVMVTPLFGEDGGLAWFLGSQVDLGEDSTALFSSRRERAAIQVKALPPRQRQVLELVAKGLLNKQIADRLEVQERTVKAHLSAIFDRLGVRNRTQASVVLRELELVDPARQLAG